MICSRCGVAVVSTVMFVWTLAGARGRHNGAKLNQRRMADPFENGRMNLCALRHGGKVLKDGTV